MARYKITERQMKLRESVTYETHDQVLREIQDLINTGRWESMGYIKLDGSIRLFNIHLPPKEVLTAVKNQPRYDPQMKNIKRIWDRNAINRDGTRGGWRSAKLERLIFFKAGNVLYDFTKANWNVISKADQATIQALLRQRQGNNINTIVVE